VQVLPTICRLEAALPRTAENAAPAMRLPRTMTLPARNTLMALPFWPEPPARAPVSSMRLSVTSVPSSPAFDRHTRMPLLPAPRIVLPAILKPRASSENIPAASTPLTLVPETSPSTLSSITPWPPAATISQSVMRNPRP
jgi:hypothetical protein